MIIATVRQRQRSLHKRKRPGHLSAHVNWAVLLQGLPVIIRLWLPARIVIPKGCRVIPNGTKDLSTRHTIIERTIEIV